MLYMLLISYDPTVAPAPGEPATLQPQHSAVEQEMRAEGIFVSGAGLMPPEFAPPVRVRRGKAVDGPFAETKELIGGYYIVECVDAAEAAKQAARIPVDSRSWVDVRADRALSCGCGSLSRRCRDWADEKWHGWRDSNPRPAVLETAALPTELHPFADDSIRSVRVGVKVRGRAARNRCGRRRSCGRDRESCCRCCQHRHRT